MKLTVKKKYIGFLLMTIAVLVVYGSYVHAEMVSIGDFAVTWTPIYEGLSHFEYLVEVQNLDNIKHDFDMAVVISDTNLPVGSVENIQLYEWKGLNVEVPVYETQFVSKMCEYVDNTTYPSTVYDVDCSYEHEVKIDTVTKIKNAWKPTKMALITQSDKVSADYGEINIPKAGSDAKYDSFGDIETVNGIKKFKVSFDIPFIDNSGIWGASSGLIGILEQTTGDFYHPWFGGSAYGFRYKINSNSTTVNVINVTLGGNVYWLLNATATEDVYAYCQNSGCDTGAVVFANTTHEKFWFNETDGIGYSPNDVSGEGDDVVTAWWPLYNLTGTDVSGSGYNLTVVGTPDATEGVFGKGSSVHETDDYWTINDGDVSALIEGKGAITITGWVWLNETPSGFHAYFWNKDILVGARVASGANPRQIDAYVTADALIEQISADAIIVNTWYFLAQSYDGSDAKFYINETLQDSDSGSGNTGANAAPFELGSDGSANVLKGMIDDVRVYSSALTQKELQDIYYQAKNNHTHLDTEEVAAEPDGPYITNVANDNRKAWIDGTLWDLDKTFGFEVASVVSHSDAFFNTSNITFEANFSGSLVNYSYDSVPSYVRNDSQYAFYINFSQEQFEGAGHYRWRWFATNGTESVGNGWNYSIEGLNATDGMTLTGTTPIDWGDASDYEGTETNAVVNDTGCSYALKRNGTAVTNPDTTVLSGGVHNYTYYTDGCRNTTAGQLEDFLTVTPVDAGVSMQFRPGKDCCGAGDLTAYSSNLTVLNYSFVRINATTIVAAIPWIKLTMNWTGESRPQQADPTVTNFSFLHVAEFPSIVNVTSYVAEDNYTNRIVTYWITLEDVSVVDVHDSTIISGDDITIEGIFSIPHNAENLVGTLIWNGTVYANDTSVMNSTHLTLGKTFSAPALANNSQFIDFKWNYTYGSNDYGTYTEVTYENISSTPNNHTIYKPQLVACGASGGSISDETAIIIHPMNETDTFDVINASMDMTFTFTIEEEEYTYNMSTVNETYHICVFPASGNYTVDGHVQYSNSSYQTRDYFFDDVIFDNVSTSIDMTLLSTTLGPKIVIMTVKDQYGSLYENVVVKPQRWYPALAEYRTVFAGLTDGQGQTSGYLELDYVYYRFLLEKDGTELDTISRMVIPDTGAVYLEVSLVVSPEEIIEWIKYWNRLTGSCAYANTTGNLTCTYRDYADVLESVQFTVREYRGALASSVICSASNTSTPTGSFICNIGNESAYTYIYEYSMMAQLDTGTEDEYLILKEVLDFLGGRTRLFGDCDNANNWAKCEEGAIITFLFVLTAALVGAYNPAVSILMTLAGLSVATVVGLYAISIQFIIGLVFVAGVLIYYMRS